MRTRRQASPKAAERAAAAAVARPGLAVSTDQVLETKGHDSVYEKGGDSTAGDATGPETILPLWTLASDPAVIVFALLHVVALATPWLYRGFSASDAVLVAASYTARMFGITAGFHRLMSHRSFQTSRPVQFALAWLGTSSLQKGPLWWCSHHRHHHRTADTDADAHSPVAHGFWWSHCGWFLLTDRHTTPLLGAVPDLVALPELVWLERFYLVPPASLAAGMWLYGGGRALCYGFCVATVLCWHATYAINSVAHLLGSRTFACQFNGPCTARNNLVLALLTLGEGWHNNHHRFMASALHGFVQPWEVDLTFYCIRLLEFLGLAWNLRKPPGDLIAHAYAAAAKHTAVLQ